MKVEIITWGMGVDLGMSGVWGIALHSASTYGYQHTDNVLLVAFPHGCIPPSHQGPLDQKSYNPSQLPIPWKSDEMQHQDRLSYEQTGKDRLGEAPDCLGQPTRRPMLLIVATADRGVGGRVPHGARGLNGVVDPGKQTPHFTRLGLEKCHEWADDGNTKANQMF